MSELDVSATRSDVDFVPIASFPDPSVLAQAHALLDAAPIPYFVENENVQNLVGLGSAIFGYNPAVGAPVLCVPATRVEEARALIEPLFAAPPESPADSFVVPAACPACGRRLESEPGDPPTTECWHCGASLVPGAAATEALPSREPGPGTELARIADQLRRALRGDAWHGPALLELLAGVDAAQANAHPVAGAHSIAELVHHVSAWRDAVRGRLEGVPVRLDDAQDWPPPGEGDAAWTAALEELERSTARLVDALARGTDAGLDEPILPGFPSRYVTLHGVVQHDLYHAGQIALLKKAFLASDASVGDA